MENSGGPPNKVDLTTDLLRGRYGRAQLARIRRRNIRRYVARGMSTKEMAPLLGMTPESVNRVRRALGLAAPNAGRFGQR